MPHSIFREPTPEERELASQRLRLRRLRQALAGREMAIGDLRGTLFSFEGRYIRQVGILYKQLDEWERKRAALHALDEKADDEDDVFDDLARTQTQQPELSLRALFRELAKRIHPDFALDATDEAHRTRLMTQANDAFLRHDRSTLERMLHGHDVAELSAAQSVAAQIDWTLEQVAGIERDLAAAEAELHALANSEIADLQRQVIAAARDGRDLLAESAKRVQGLIGIAMRQYELDLHRIKHPPRGLNVESLLSAEAPGPEPIRFDPMRRTWRK
jgi:hypothetical protein